MKGKKGIYILLPVVIAIWGIIGYKIYKSVYPDVNRETTANTIDFKAVADTTQETYTLAANYYDPFLSGIQSKKYSDNATNKNPKALVKPKNLVPEKTPLVWPLIKYKGSVINQQSNVQIALVSINNKDFLFKKGETKLDLTVLEIKKDSVKISFKEKIVFFKNSNAK